MITLNESRIPRRGKGAKGSVEVKTLGVPTIDEATGIATNFNYDHVEAMPVSELIEFIQSNGFSVNLCLARGLDLNLKSGAIKSQNEKSMIQAMLVSKGLAEKGKAGPLAQTVITYRNQFDCTIDEVIEQMVAQKAKKELREKEKAEAEKESE